MFYRRDESFRFYFGTPIEGTFTILKIDGKDVYSKEGSASILDLSPNGVRFTSSLNLPIETKKMIMKISLVLNEKELSFLAQPVWKKRIGPSSFSYGLSGMEDEETKAEIVEELKLFAKNQHG